MSSQQHFTLQGPPALSPFRRAILATKLGALDVQAHYVHHVALEDHHQLEQQERVILEQVLDYEESPDPAASAHGSTETTRKSEQGKVEILHVFPRHGTLSPWSSKATSIVEHACSFGNKVKRIERGSVITVMLNGNLDISNSSIADLLYDRMTQTLSLTPPDLNVMFAEHKPAPAKVIPMHGEGVNARRNLEAANKELGLALDASDIEYLSTVQLGRSLYDVELFMFAQINSEHCRHKIFNASQTIDGVEKQYSLFDMIRNTHKQNGRFIISAYSDNAAVMEGPDGSYLAPSALDRAWTQTREKVHYVAKVETHNHPTAVQSYHGIYSLALPLYWDSKLIYGF